MNVGRSSARAGEPSEAIPVRAHLIRLQLMKACEVFQQWGFQRFPAGSTEQQWTLAGVDQAHFIRQNPRGCGDG